ncbi:MAG: hypothetical protein M3N39_12865 [Pseudomonadota bacterium]|nr:hypothetical protein [Pseudomonadota bacterium]
MSTADTAAALEFKRTLEKDFEAASGLDGRAYYSAVYSLPQRSPLMWLNLNPGGTPEEHRVLSDEQLARGEHEFWHGDGKTSKATGAFLQRIFQTPFDRLRSVQGTNVAWERSPKGHDIDLRAAAKRAAPFLGRYIQHARPDLLIFGGSAAFDLFVETFEATTEKVHEVLMGNWGSSQARIFMATALNVPTLGHLETITVSHPSRGVRAGVLERCRARLAGVKLPKAIV